MAIDCTPTSLANASRGFYDLASNVQQAIRVVNYCALLNGDTMDCSPQALADAARCFAACLNSAQLAAVETYLSCQIANGGGGGGGQTQVFNGHYGGLEPTQTPTTSAAIAYDLDSPFDVWTWDGSAWN